MLLLLSLLACTDVCNNPVISVSIHETVLDEQMSGDPCYTPTVDGLDLSGCCPDGYDAIGMADGDEAVLCQEQCGIGADKSVAATEQGIYVVANVLNAIHIAVDAIRDNNWGPPPGP